MPELEPILKTAILNLRSGRLDREEDVKLAVILPILNALDWRSADPGALRPEYPAGPGRVDYALLCHGRPQVFVEAKRRGALDARAESQLFGYAANNGVPLLVLSDGLCWDFYLSMADGRPEERRFHRLELRSDDRVPEYAATLDNWLHRRQVASGDARRGAESRLERDRSLTRARDALPGAWRALIEEPDGLLCDLLAERVAAMVGTEPRRSDIEEFLRHLPASRRLPVPAGRSPAPAPERPVARELPARPAGDGAPRTRGVGGSREGASLGAPSVPKSAAAAGAETLQDLVRDLMRTVLEDFPDTLDGETIERLETTTNPMGLKIGNHALIRKVADGTQVRGRNRYWTQPFGGRWYVCSQWWRQDHRHNARKLAAWVESLIGDMEDGEARRALRDIFHRISAHGE